MAGPVVHGGVTLPISLIAFLFGGWQWSVQIPIWFLGVFMDFFDHISPERIRRLIQGDIKPVENQLNWMHTFTALVVILVFSSLLQNWFILFSFLLHNYIDAGDKGNRDNPAGPLPSFLSRFFPEKWKYRTETKSSVLAKMFSWPQKIKKLVRRGV